MKRDLPLCIRVMLTTTYGAMVKEEKAKTVKTPK